MLTAPKYITSNTLDEISHATFINAYLVSRGAKPVDFSEFETLPGSTAKGSSGKLRITNLMNLNVDTSWYVRYRSTTNPDFGASFPQAITLENVTAIPRDNSDFHGAKNPNFPGNDHIQAIANVAAFFTLAPSSKAVSSLYSTLSQKVSDPEVLQITIGIGGDEVAHFLEWVDFAGNGVQQPIAPFHDKKSGLAFPDFFNNPPVFPPSLVQPSLIFPLPCEFISPSLPLVAVFVHLLTNLEVQWLRPQVSSQVDSSPAKAQSSSTHSEADGSGSRRRHPPASVAFQFCLCCTRNRGSPHSTKTLDSNKAVPKKVPENWTRSRHRLMMIGARFSWLSCESISAPPSSVCFSPQQHNPNSPSRAAIPIAPTPS